MVPQLFSPTSFVLEGFQTQCSFNYIDRDAYTRSFMIIMVFGGFIAPLFINIFFYIQIWFILKSNEFFINYSSKLNDKPNEDEMICAHNAIKLNDLRHNSETKSFLKQKTSDPSQPNSKSNKIIRNEVKLLKSIILIIFMFCVAWFPYALITLLAQFGSRIENYITPFTTSLPSLFAKLSSVYNPLVFLMLNKKCKKFVMKKLFLI